MAREFSGPLTEEDLVFLGQRYPAATVDRYVELYGVEGAEQPGEPDQDPDEADEDAESGPAADDDEDLIGDGGDTDTEQENLGDVAADLYDPLSHTTQEVRAYMKTASVDEVNRIKVIEGGREDREPRTSITGFNPS